MSCELSIDQLAEIAVDVVRVGMAIALDPPCDLAVDTKSNRNDLVTAVDRAIEEEIAARLEETTGLPLLGEEGHAVDSFARRLLSRTSKRSLRCRGSRGHCKRAEDTDATAPLRWSASRLRAGARVPSCTCGYPRGISRRRPLLRPSAGRWQRGWTVRPLTCATRVRSSWLLPASMPRWWRGS